MRDGRARTTTWATTVDGRNVRLAVAIDNQPME